MFDMRDLVASFIGPPAKVGRIWHWWCCPIHNESEPSFAVDVDHAHCFGCGWHGNWQWFARQVLGWRDAPQVSTHQPVRGVSFDLPQLPPSTEWQVTFGRLVSEAEVALERSVFAQKELERRCISPEAWQRYRVGYHPMWEQVGETKFAPGWVLPCFKDGKLWSVNVRVKGSHPKYHRPEGGCRVVPFGLGQLRGRDTLIVCEGEFDALAVASQIDADVIALRGAGNVTSLVGFPHRRVVTAMDGDDGGREALGRLQVSFPQWEHRVVPDGYDVGKLAQEGVPLAAFLLEGVLL